MIEELRNIKKNQNIDIIENKSTEQDTNKSLTDYDISKPEELSNYFKEMNIKVLEDFELQELIGKGSESYVYKALYKKNKRTVACKIIQRENGKINKNEFCLISFPCSISFSSSGILFSLLEKLLLKFLKELKLIF